MAQILQVNFKFNVPREQYENTVSPMAQDFANVPGLLWKVWLMNTGFDRTSRAAAGVNTTWSTQAASWPLLFKPFFA